MKPKRLFIADGSVTVVLGVIFVVLPGLALNQADSPVGVAFMRANFVFDVLGAALSFIRPAGRT